MSNHFIIMLKTIQLLSIGFFLSYSCVAQSYLGYTVCPTYLTDSLAHHHIAHTGKGDALILPSLEHKHGLYKVIHVKSKKEGFVSVHDLTIEKNLPNSQSDLMASLDNSDIKDPVIKIHNKSKKIMTVVLNQDKYDIEPHETATLHVKAGKYHSKVLITNTDPIYNFDVLENFKLYDWNYFVQ